VTQWKVGDKALILRSDIGVNRAGTFAQRVAVPVDSLMPVPSEWSMEQASGASLIYLTAHQALTMWGELPPSVVLITGASGGVGVASLQLGKAMGHTILCLSRSSQKQQKLKEMGADFCLDPNDTQWRRRVKEFLGEKRVDLVIDNIGGPLFSETLDTLGMHGKVSCVGRLAGPVPQFNTASLFFRRLRVGGVAAATYSREEAQATWRECLKLLKKTDARPVVDRAFDFEQLPEAFEYLAKGPMGKVLLAGPKM
jgi:NADPH2:quinone reductase